MTHTESSENFDKAPPEKQQAVVNAGFACFARDGYKKTAMSEIAAMAGVSKPSLFHYFGSKAGLYEYLSRYIMRFMLDAFKRSKAELLTVTDYFERISRSMLLKIDMMKAHPSILAFSASMFTEQDAEVRPMIEGLLGSAFAVRDDMLLIGIDEGKFKDPADIARIGTMTDWMATGAAEKWKGTGAGELDKYMGLFDDCLAALKSYFYKGEYL